MAAPVEVDCARLSESGPRDGSENAGDGRGEDDRSRAGIEPTRVALTLFSRRADWTAAVRLPLVNRPGCAIIRPMLQTILPARRRPRRRAGSGAGAPASGRMLLAVMAGLLAVSPRPRRRGPADEARLRAAHPGQRPDGDPLRGPFHADRPPADGLPRRVEERTARPHRFAHLFEHMMFKGSQNVALRLASHVDLPGGGATATPIRPRTPRPSSRRFRRRICRWSSGWSGPDGHAPD